MFNELEELLEQNIKLMNRFIAENDELNRAFQNETLGEFISSHNTTSNTEDEESYSTKNNKKQIPLPQGEVR